MNSLSSPLNSSFKNVYTFKQMQGIKCLVEKHELVTWMKNNSVTKTLTKNIFLALLLFLCVCISTYTHIYMCMYMSTFMWEEVWGETWSHFVDHIILKLAVVLSAGLSIMYPTMHFSNTSWTPSLVLLPLTHTSFQSPLHMTILQFCPVFENVISPHSSQ